MLMRYMDWKNGEYYHSNITNFHRKPLATP